MKIKSIIIDDEILARELLKNMLEAYCPDVEVLAMCENLPEGVKAIKKHQPDLIFLDIEMPGFNGLEILDFFNEDEVNFSIIFTTAYNKFAINAFKLSAVDYLLKPLEGEELEQSVQRFKNRSKKESYNQLNELIKSKKLDKITITTSNATKFVVLDDIVYLKGEGAYTYFYLKNRTEILSSKNLKQYEDILSESTNFFRSHKSHIINLNYLSEIIKKDGFFALLDSHLEIAISPKKIEELTKRMSE